MMRYMILKLQTRYIHRPSTGMRRMTIRSLVVLSCLMMFTFVGVLASAQDSSDGNKFPLPSTPNSTTDVDQSGVPLAAGSLAIRAVQGTPGAPAIGAAEIEVELIQDGQIIDHIETQLDEFGVIVLRDLPIAGGIIPLVRVHYGDVKYQQPGELMDPEHPQQRLDVTCYETTEDKPAWTMGTRHIMMTEGGPGVHVSEFIVVDNPSERTWLGDGEGEPGSDTRRTVVFAVPKDATEVRLGSGFLSHAAVIEPGFITSRLPLMPGKNEFKFDYHLPADHDGRIEVTIPQSAPVDQLMVILPSGVTVDSSEGVKFDREVSMGTGPAVAMYLASDVKPEQVISMKLSGITGGGAEMGEANLAATGEPIISRSSGMAVKLFAGFGAAVLLLLGIAFILMKSPKKAVEEKK